MRQNLIVLLFWGVSPQHLYKQLWTLRSTEFHVWKEIYLVHRILKTDYMTHTYIILVGEVMSQAQSEGPHFIFLFIFFYL